jgi:hypothetical protein
MDGYEVGLSRPVVGMPGGAGDLLDIVRGCEAIVQQGADAGDLAIVLLHEQVGVGQCRCLVWIQQLALGALAVA